MATSPKTFTLMTAAEFGKLCDSVMKAQRKTDDDLQKLAITAIAYTHIHGDVQPANRLIGAMQKSLRVDSMVKYIEKFGKLAWQKDEKKFAYYADAPVREFDADVCNTLKWHDAKKPNPVVSQYDFVAEFDEFMKRLAKKIDSGKPIIHAELFDKLVDVSAEVHAKLHETSSEGAEQ